MGLTSSKSEQPEPNVDHVFPSSQYLLPIFGHPADIASLRLLGDFSSNDNHLFGISILTPLVQPITANVSNQQLIDRFGLVSDLNLDTILHHLETSTPFAPKSYSAYGGGPELAPPHLNDLRFLSAAMLADKVDPETQLRLDPFGYESLPWPGGELTNGLSYRSFHPPTHIPLRKIITRYNLVNPTNIPDDLPGTENDSGRLEFYANDNDNPNNHYFVYPNTNHYTKHPLTYNGIFASSNPKLIGKNKARLDQYFIVVKQFEMDSDEHDVVRDDGSSSKNPFSAKSLPKSVPFLKISFLDTKTHATPPEIYSLDLTPNTKYNGDRPARNRHERMEEWFAKINPRIPNHHLEHIINPPPPPPPSPQSSEDPSSHTKSKSKSILWAPRRKSQTATYGDGNGDDQLMAFPTKLPLHFETSELKSTYSQFTYPDPVCIAVRPVYGYRNSLLDPTQPEPEIRFDFAGEAFCGEVNPDNIIPDLAELRPTAIDEIRSAVKKMTQYLGTILIIDSEGDSGPTILTDFVQETQALIKDSSCQFNPTTRPLWIIFLSNCALDREIVSQSEVYNRLSEAGFTPDQITMTIVKPSPTRCMDRPKQDVSMVGCALHNGPFVTCEALMRKFQWDEFVKPITKELYHLQFAKQKEGTDSISPKPTVIGVDDEKE